MSCASTFVRACATVVIAGCAHGVAPAPAATPAAARVYEKVLDTLIGSRREGIWLARDVVPGPANIDGSRNPLRYKNLGTFEPLLLGIADSSSVDLASLVRPRRGMKWSTDSPKYDITRSGRFPLLLTLSRVSFSPDSSQAAVYTTYWCGGLCGEGRYYFLVLSTSDGWEIVGSLQTYVS